MHILFAASEATPYSKTGGLADVCSALPKALAKLGRKVSIVTPLYKCVRDYFEKSAERLIPLRGVELNVRIGDQFKKASVRHAKMTDADVDVYFIEHDAYFYRDGLYNFQGVDYGDNCERYSFFSNAVLELIRTLNLDVDVVHANDWQTALVPALLDTKYKSRSRFSDERPMFFQARPRLQGASFANGGEIENPFDKIKSVVTIHNMRHQGRFWQGAVPLTGMDWSYFTFDKMEFYGQLNLLKTGLVFSDAITTVSPSYAEEIKTEYFGEKLQGVLCQREADLCGILNGVDLDEWNPATDEFIPANYDVNTVFEQKPICKAALQKEFGLTQDPNVPLFGVVSRFDPQKGLDLVAEAAAELIEREGAQIAILGSGEQKLTDRFTELARRYPNNFGLCAKFSVELAHLVEAGADIFLMPSRYEPCGLNQMYSLRYGTLPVVRETGGLQDSVVAYNKYTGEGTGFRFTNMNADEMANCVLDACEVFWTDKDAWIKLQRQAMETDFSWSRAAGAYMDMYHSLHPEIGR
ncbi:MAG: glycogen synthase [Thermoguttaceae bacterium]|nr:glycogen synthase [Thermoguttaceae bacterium]